jgi:uncharacterized protein YggE
MPAEFRPVVISIAVAIVSSLVVALVVVSANRQTTIIAGPSASSANAPLAFGVLTTGDATVSKRPDEAFISAAVQSEQSTAAAAQSDLAAKSGKLINKIKALGVADSDVSTSGYWVGPVYRYDQNISSYRADEQVRIKWHNVDSVGKALDALVQDGGATRITVGFGLADPKAAQAEARTAAIADARAKAQAMASAAGVKLAQALRVSDLVSNSRYPGPFEFAGAASTNSTQVPVGELAVQVTVEVDFAIA